MVTVFFWCMYERGFFVSNDISSDFTTVSLQSSATEENDEHPNGTEIFLFKE